MRDTLFIGHANTEDNDFTLWLIAKLRNEGYKAECDLTLLLGGEEDYWQTLQNFLEANTAKYLLVLSNDSFKKQGVVDEWEQVKIIARKNKLKDFIYILKIDNVPFDVRIGVPTKNHFRFDVSWSNGLKNLLLKLNRDTIHRTGSRALSIDDWLRNRFSNSKGTIDREEVYYSNWLKINSLPENFYFYKYHNETQAKKVVESLIEYPIIRHESYAITFMPDIPISFKTYEYPIEYISRKEVNIERAFKRIEYNEFPEFNDVRRFLVQILKVAWNKKLASRNLHSHLFSRKVTAFYYTTGQLEKDKIQYWYEGKKTHKQLLGDYYTDFWHFAVSNTVLLHSQPLFCIKSHLIFTSDGYNVWKSKNKLQRARKNKGKGFYNREWRSLLLGFLASLSDDGSVIEIPLGIGITLLTSTIPTKFTSMVDYEEPKSSARLVPIDYVEDEEDEDFYLEEE